MSGFKRAMVTISEEEYRKLHNLDIEKRFKVSKPVEDNHDKSQVIALEKQLRDLQNRQVDYEIIIKNLGKEINSYEVETERAMIAEKAGFYEILADQVDDIWQNNTRLETLVENFQLQVIQDNVIRDRHMMAVNEQISNLYAQQDNKNEVVLSWLQSAGELADFISKQYDHYRFLPGEMDRVYRQFDLIQDNLAQGMAETALGQAQKLYQDLLEHRLKLEQQTLEWQTLFQVTTRVARNLYELVKNNSSCPALDMDGRELPVSLQLNYWSNGRFNTLLQNIKNTILNMQTEIGSITSRQMESILQNDLPRFREEFDEIIYQSRFAAINSQLRINIADIALQALTTQGYAEEEFGYVADDRRNEFFLRVKNIEGSEITIWVNPIDERQNSSDLVVESHDSAFKTERELRLRANEITKSLQIFGLQVSDLKSEKANILDNRISNIRRSQRNSIPSSLHNPRIKYTELKNDRKN